MRKKWFEACGVLNVLQQANPNCTTLRLVAPRCILGGAGDLVSKIVSGVIIGVTPFGVLITLLITLLTKSPAPPSILSPAILGPSLKSRQALGEEDGHAAVA